MDRWEGGGRCLLVQEEPYIIFAQLSKRTRPVWEKACFPGLGIGPSWWETIACLACTRALVPSPAPVWECRSVIQHSGDADKKDHKFKAIQGWPGLQETLFQRQRKGGNGRAHRESPSPARLGSSPSSAGTPGRVCTATPIYTGPPLPLPFPAPLLGTHHHHPQAPLRKPGIHTSYSNCQPLSPRES